MILLDTSILIDSLAGPRRSEEPLRDAIERGERILMPALVLYEWLRGPRREQELRAQETLLPREFAVVFGPEEAALAARLYIQVRRPRGREIDLAIAACALIQKAAVWTLNTADFEDIPGLRLWKPSR